MAVQEHNKTPEEVESLAAHCHDEQWSGWMKYLFSKCSPAQPEVTGAMVIPGWAVDRWTRQMSTPYSELPEEMRESDREEARKILAVMKAEAGVSGHEKTRYRDPKSPRRLELASQTCSHVGTRMNPYPKDLHTDLERLREQFDDDVILRAAAVVLKETIVSWYGEDKEGE